MVIDNKDSPNRDHLDYTPMFMSWNKDLPLKMGWIEPLVGKKDTYRLGPNLTPESYTENG